MNTFSQIEEQHERRRFERFVASPMHHGITVEYTNDWGETRRLDGHAYDISLGGACIELDEAIQPGTTVDARVHIPEGFERGPVDAISATARIVWLGDTSEPGPVRMAFSFQSFESDVVVERLSRFLRGGVIRWAA